MSPEVRRMLRTSYLEMHVTGRHCQQLLARLTDQGLRTNHDNLMLPVKSYARAERLIAEAREWLAEHGYLKGTP